MPDSMVHGHISILREYAAKRSVSDALYREYRDEAYQRHGQVLELNRAISNYRLLVKQNEDEIEALVDSNTAMAISLAANNEKLNKLRPWATIGKAGTVVVSVAVIGIVTARVLSAAK